MKYYDAEKMREIQDELEKRDSELAGSLEQGDDGTPLLPPLKEHDSVPRNW
jgi:hypothetical protein